MAHYVPTSGSKIATVLRVTSGNFLEMFDFFLFGFYATYISKAFFPSGNELHLADADLHDLRCRLPDAPARRHLPRRLCRQDRPAPRASSSRSAIMAMGTILIAFVPGYATIGLLAPILVLIGRLLQGFSAGVELGGVSVYLAEMATPGNKGFYVAWQSGSQQVAIMFAAIIGYVLNQALAPVGVGDWGWRVPFFIGCADRAVPVLHPPLAGGDGGIPARKKHQPTLGAGLQHASAATSAIVLLGMLMVAMTTISFYAITVYTPTFGKSVLKLTETDSLIVTFCVARVQLHLAAGDGRPVRPRSAASRSCCCSRRSPCSPPTRRWPGWSGTPRSRTC